jgi:hypothetical protein
MTGQSPCGLAVNAGHIYWGEDTGSQVGRSNLDGGSPDPTFIDTPAGGNCGVAVNLTHVFWAVFGGLGAGTSIGRAGISNPASADDSYIGGATSPCGVAVDSSRIYWANEAPGTIGIANLDSTGVNQTFISGGSGSCGVAVDSLAPPPDGGGGAVEPSNQFSFGKVKLNKRKGTATLPATVPGAGSLTLAGKGVKPQRPTRAARGRAAKTVNAAGIVKLKITPKGKTRKKLNRRGKAKVKLTITFTPTGGSPNAKGKTIKLVRKR